MLLALMATGAGEYSREMLRKPYVIGHWMYSNGVRVPYVNRIDQQGYLAHSNWVWNGSDTSYSHGEAIFRGECGSCHTMDGYRPMRQLLSGRDRANIGSFVTMLHDYKPDMPYRRFMPPMVGTAQDVNDLTDFLNAKVNPAAASGPVQTAQR
jgi:cytochrome c553